MQETADGAFAKHLVALQVARGDDEILQGVALQIIHHHVDGFVFAEEVQHRHHAGVADLRERTAFFEKAFQAQPVQRLLVGLDPGREFARGTFGERCRQVFLDGDGLFVFAFGQINDAETACGQFLDDLVAPDHGARRQRGWFGL